LEIRVIGDEDVPAWVDVRTRSDPDWPVGVDETLFWRRIDHDPCNVVAYLDGEPVGAAVARADLGDPDLPHGDGRIWVPPDRRGQGIGGALAGVVRQHLQRLGKTEWRGEVKDGDAHTLGFLERRGFREIARSQEVGLDLTGWTSPGWPIPEGITITDFATRPDVARGMSRVENEVVVDIPPHGDEPHTPLPFAEFEALLRKPGLDHRLVIVAMEGEEVVGYGILSRNQVDETLGYHWLTGVRRPWRGRGIARAIKQRQLERAQELGMRLVCTDNDLRNTPIRKLNERLGYTRRPDQLVVAAPLDASPGA
jgi:GNAT superfamily N-acetyltransferase